LNKGPSEDILQQHCFQWFRLQYPDRIIYHVPNGGKRNYLEAVKFKRMGVVAGVPDLVIPEPTQEYHGLYIELKANKNKPTPNQRTMIEQLASRGYRVEVCNEFEQFKRVVKGYFEGRMKFTLYMTQKEFEEKFSN